MSMLMADQVAYVYQSKYQKTYALKGVTCSFEPGKLYAITGQSGSGKTTLLSMLAGLGTPTSGAVYFDGADLRQIGAERHRRENVSVIYQAFNLFPTLTVLENVMYPMQIRGVSKKEAAARGSELLASVGLRDHQKKRPVMLSGGEQQRVAIARALASEAKVILADEPTGNLDTENGRIVLDILKKLVAEKNYCVIMVTHDLELAAQADQMVRMRDGQIV